MPRGTRATGYGAAGGRRNTASRSAKQVTKRKLREQDPRYKAAMEEVRLTEAKVRMLNEQNPDAATEGSAHHGSYRKIMEQLEAAQATAEKVGREVEGESNPIFYCPRCGRGSQVPEALEEGYCSFCIDWTGDPVIKPKSSKKKNPVEGLPWEGDGNGTMPPVLARARLRQGYNIRVLVEQTGFGLKHFEGCEWDEDGFGIDHLADDGKKNGKKKS